MGELFKAITGIVLWAIAIGYYDDVRRFAVREMKKAMMGPSYLPQFFPDGYEVSRHAVPTKNEVRDSRPYACRKGR